MAGLGPRGAKKARAPLQPELEAAIVSWAALHGFEEENDEE
jgi:hypothetical protein